MATEQLVRIRQTDAARYDACPLSAKLGDEAPRISSHPQGRGTVFHAFMVEFVEECLCRKAEVLPPEDAKALMARVIVESGEVVDADEVDTLMQLAWKAGAERTVDIAHVVDLEETYELAIGDVVLAGRPDLLSLRDGVVEIRDYKTSWAVDAQADVEGTFQLRVYGVMALRAYPQAHTARLVLDYPRWAITREAELHRDHLDSAETYLRLLVERIQRSRKTGEWEPVPGTWCAICPAPHRCPIPAEHRGDGAIADRDTAEQVARQLVPLERYLSTRKRALRAFCAENGGVDVGDGVWDFRLKADSDKLDDKDRLRADLKANGLQFADYFKHVKGSPEFRFRKRAAE